MGVCEGDGAGGGWGSGFIMGWGVGTGDGSGASGCAQELNASVTVRMTYTTQQCRNVTISLYVIIKLGPNYRLSWP